MDFVLNKDMLKNVVQAEDKSLVDGSLFYHEEEAYSGVNKIAKKVMHDIEMVFGYEPYSSSMTIFDQLHSFY